MFQVGEVLQGKYRVSHLLGQGGFGQTYQVDDSGVTKVLKVLQSNYPKAIDLFQREARILSQLHHPGIPQVDPDAYFVTTANETTEAVHCLVMEWIPGLDLQQWLQQQQYQPITEDRAIAWLQQLSEILEQIHRQHYFHRDIKPSNIMLKPDGQLVLIDFGAVREETETYLRKQQDNITGTSIQTRGYAPPEQFQGKAVLQSDFFALGRTFVHLLTGIYPLDFPLDLQTGQLLWREAAPQISPKLANLIDHLMAPFPGQRPAHANAILQALTAIQQDGTTIPTSAGRETEQIWPDSAQWGQWRSLPLLRWHPWWKSVLISGLVSSLVMAARLGGGLQPIELRALDHGMRLRPPEKLDSRLLIITVDAADLKFQDQAGLDRQGTSLATAALVQLLEKLAPYQPRTIGLDIYRDRPSLPFPPNPNLSRSVTQRLIGICTGSAEFRDAPPHAAPSGLPAQQLGFSDIPLDYDDVVRRQLLGMESTRICPTDKSFSYRLATHYLDRLDIQDTVVNNQLRIGNKTFQWLDPNTAAYHQLGLLGGYEILLNYRANPQVAEQRSLSSVLSGALDAELPTLVKDRMILIGTIAKIAAPFDYHQTPYGNLSGVVLQAHMVSQLLGAVLDGRPTLWYWSQWGDGLWVWVWSWVGGIVMLRGRGRWFQGLAMLGVFVGLYGVCFVILLHGGWMPLIPTALSLVVTTIVSILIQSRVQTLQSQAQ